LLRVELHMTPADLPAIPAGVEADVEIATVFGTQGINLVPPARPVAGHLLADQTISSVPRSTTTTLQGDATDLDNLLNALHPAAIDQTLTAIATALRDQGPRLGSTIAEVATYLDEMLPQLPGIMNDIDRLGPVSTQLAQAAPSIITALSNASVVSGTITGHAQTVHQLLAGGTPTADALTGLAQDNAAAFEDLVSNSQALLGDIAANPKFVAQTLAGFDAWSKAFVVAESHGPYLSFSGALTISGSVQLVAAALALPGSDSLVEQGLGPQNFNPPTYGAAGAPAEPALNGPALTTPAEQRAAVSVATALSRGTAPPSPAVATLLLQPLLRSLTGAR
jgi:phospholipid/cholesterol/gamma-HCH transport system substrate-binding protein